MNKDELIRLISGPVSAYLMPDGCSYSKFIELLNKEFPELNIHYTEVYPLLFNLEAKPIDELTTIYYDINSCGNDYLEKLRNENV